MDVLISDTYLNTKELNSQDNHNVSPPSRSHRHFHSTERPQILTPGRRSKPSGSFLFASPKTSAARRKNNADTGRLMTGNVLTRLALKLAAAEDKQPNIRCGGWLGGAGVYATIKTRGAEHKADGYIARKMFA